MDAPGFPDAAGGAYVAVVWLTLAALVVVSAAVTAACLRRGPRARGRARTGVLGAVVVLAGLVGAVWLWTPASARIDPENTQGRAECPFDDAVVGARIDADHTSRMYAFWQPCETAARVRIGTVLGGYAVLVVAVGTWQRRGTAGSGRTPQSTSRPSAATRP